MKNGPDWAESLFCGQAGKQNDAWGAVRQTLTCLYFDGRKPGVQQFKSQRSAQWFLTTHAAVYNTFYVQRHLASRATMKVLRNDAHRAWREATA